MKYLTREHKDQTEKKSFLSGINDRTRNAIGILLYLIFIITIGLFLWFADGDGERLYWKSEKSTRLER
jgi:hypothetical protein